MPYDDLVKMRQQIMPDLMVALGEMQQARDLIALLLASHPAPASSIPNDILPQLGHRPPPPPQQEQAATPDLLTSTIVTKPPSIVSVQAFNAQLALGSKDEALRKASKLFKDASEDMERSRVKEEKYFLDGLKIRRENWGMVPAPLPLWMTQAKGSERTAKDLLVCFGLEESPPTFRRQAIANMGSYESDAEPLIFPHRQRTRLRVSLTTTTSSGARVQSYNTITHVPLAAANSPTVQKDSPTAPQDPSTPNDSPTLNSLLQQAQHEIVDREMFSVLVREAGHLPTAAALVREKFIVIEAAQDVSLRFDMVDNETLLASALATAPIATSPLDAGKCDLIYSALQALLLRQHAINKKRRLAPPGTLDAHAFLNPLAHSTYPLAHAPPILQPIIDVLQYAVFCDRVKQEMTTMASGVVGAGIACTLRFDTVGEVGRELVRMLDSRVLDPSQALNRPVGGEAVLVVDGRHSIRFTFHSPSTLVAHLAQAEISIVTIPQLTQLLADEVDKCLLLRVCQIGEEACASVSGTWFVDLDRCVGRWDGCILTVKLSYQDGHAIDCTVYRLDSRSPKEGRTDVFSKAEKGAHTSLLAWIESIIQAALQGS
ncbi:subunit 17 of mediator complex-domain-containing protein [Schizophyllum amplum]|uniref:Mediator of RNA polymerase II transcription subunit 17 n=1 Tax=Schizophyllum amplum TaxID=97359 RepID=A0A550CSM4_9AGAR|nr:subunit 17 of mediator complex-domain-containing protein [Auriculariopsis ampla]